MIEPGAVFSASFVPVDGGYLFYPSAKSGGRLVTAAEYESVLARHRRASGWPLTTAILALFLLYAIPAVLLEWPKWTIWPFVLLCIAILTGVGARSARLTRRLVKDRPEISPPRPRSEAARQIRAIFSWQVVGYILTVTGIALASALAGIDGKLTSWISPAAIGVIFICYVILAVLKLKDRGSE